ncbi:MAG: STAS domain-containing protein [Clostridiales bacterium]|jgi:stage II sporulation protein AA (anti-sigma F factor antagonist)|nr:STAS domain-containing protein [Clostridiales bacterium]
MTVHREFWGGRLVIYICGELDESNIDIAREEFDKGIADNPNTVVLEMSELKFIDSTGIGMIISRYKRLKSMGVPMYVKGLKAQTEKVFRMSGLLSIIKIAH